jgi:hypothetical protein
MFSLLLHGATAPHRAVGLDLPGLADWLGRNLISAVRTSPHLNERITRNTRPRDTSSAGTSTSNGSTHRQSNTHPLGLPGNARALPDVRPWLGLTPSRFGSS